MTNYLLSEVEVLKQIKEKYEKAIEIIKQKNVDIGWLLFSFEKYKDVDYYNHVYDTYQYVDQRFINKELTKEEYETLKETLWKD